MLIMAKAGRNHSPGMGDPFIQVAARQNYERVYLSIAADRTVAADAGPIDIDATITRGGSRAKGAPRPPIVLPEFGRGSALPPPPQPPPDLAPLHPAATP